MALDACFCKVVIPADKAEADVATEEEMRLLLPEEMKSRYDW
jgi:hypothetical protein